MVLTSTPRETFRFGDFELDVSAYQLRCLGRSVRLERRPMDLLVLLVERRGQLVSRNDIVEQLWGKDVFVEVETGVNTLVWKIRAALRDSPEAPMFVETVAGRGYRFIAPVEVISGRHVSPESSSPQVPESFDPPAAVVVTTPTPAPHRMRLEFGLLAIVLAAALVVWVWLAASGPGPRITIAVLPFENLGADPDRQYLADGLTEETGASLAQIDPDRLSVKGRTMSYKGTAKGIDEIGRELSVDYLVASSIRAEGGRLRVTAKLIRVRDQEHVWSQSYDREPTSLLGLQQELSTAIAEQIRLRLSSGRVDALARRQTRSADAYDLYLRGQNFANQRTPPTTRRAIEYYERATALDPNYALAWSGLADAYAASTLNGDAPPLDVWPRVREAAAQAVRADPNLAETQMSLGSVAWYFDWDWPAAERALRRAIALDPSSGRAHRTLGHILSQSGKHAEAGQLMRRARELDPLEPMTHAMSSQVAFQARDYPAALEHARQSIVLDPEFWIGYMQEGQAYEQTGQIDLALEGFSQAARFSRGNSKAISIRGYLLAKVARGNEAREVLSTLEALSRDRYVPPYAIALVRAGLGDRDGVFEWLNRAYGARDVHLMFLTVDPKWDPYRADSRFQDLLARCGFRRNADHRSE